MFTLEIRKPDGRYQILYSRRPIPKGIIGTSPEKEPLPRRSHLRWHPLRREWVVYATHRQNRTFLPPPDFNPLAVAPTPDAPQELPAGDYDMTVFENLFPSLGSREAPPHLIVPTEPAGGTCEVVVFTKDPTTSLGALPLTQVELLFEVWAERTQRLGERPDVAYVFAFENRGVEVGVTLHHPHGQIYAYPFVPPLAERMLEAERLYYSRHRRTLMGDHVGAELAAEQRVLFASEHAAAFVPVCARYPYEVWIAPRRPTATFADLGREQIVDLARALKLVLRKYDALWDRPFPYVMAWHQSPTDGAPHPEGHLHAELYPPYRMRDRLKYLAGSEIGAGVFTADALPEEGARQLRDVHVTVD